MHFWLSIVGTAAGALSVYVETKDHPSLRSVPRTRVLMNATLFTPDGAFRVRVRDISRVGAQLYSYDRIHPGCDAIFKRGPLFLAARVVWTRGEHSGISFYRELTADELAHLPPQIRSR